MEREVIIKEAYDILMVKGPQQFFKHCKSINIREDEISRIIQIFARKAVFAS